MIGKGTRGAAARKAAGMAARFAFLYLCISFVAIVASEARAGDSVIHIRDDETGGDCGMIGSWDRPARTCTMTGDTDGVIIIDSDYVTLDGDGHLMNGSYNGASESETDGDAVTVVGRVGVTIKDISIRRYNYAVDLEYSSGCTITGIRASENAHAGISFTGSSNNRVIGNRVWSNGIDTGICIGYNSDANEITGNVISDTARGIFIHTFCDGNEVSGNYLLDNRQALTIFDRDSGNVVSGNVVRGNDYGLFVLGGSYANTFSDNEVAANGHGILIKSADGNRIQANSFRGNELQAEIMGGLGNSFSGEPGGGNYWDDFDTVPEGCTDNGSGRCGAPYAFRGGSDDQPLTSAPRPACGRPQLVLAGAESSWGSYDDYRIRRLAVTMTLANTGDIDADDVEITGASSPGSASLVEDAPLPLGTIAAGASDTVTLHFMVPAGASSFTVFLGASASDPCGGHWLYPDATALQ